MKYGQAMERNSLLDPVLYCVLNQRFISCVNYVASAIKLEIIFTGDLDFSNLKGKR